MSYQVFKPGRFICEQALSSHAFAFKGPSVEFADPARAPGIFDNVTTSGRFYLSKTVVAFTTKPGLKVRKANEGTPMPGADYDISCVYGCPHRCVYCPHIYLCKTYPYIAMDPRIETVEDAVHNIASKWKAGRPFVCQVGSFTDLLATDHLTGWLSRLIRFFSDRIAPHGKLQFLTRSGHFEPLVKLNHRRATRVGVALTPAWQTREMEPGTATLAARLNFLTRVIAAGYPAHVSFSPILLMKDYKKACERLFEEVAKALMRADFPEMPDLTMDVRIHQVRPESEVVIEELDARALEGMETRRIGGRSRLVYPAELHNDAIRHFRRMIPQYLPEARLVSVR
jgi:DNA repair photolyase